LRFVSGLHWRPLIGCCLCRPEIADLVLEFPGLVALVEFSVRNRAAGVGQHYETHSQKQALSKEHQ
jgi:hypothetical protein